ncbi:hypothetical protein [Rhodococcus opacus]|nr:hypothetical protein [Rhodococcus opacus]
MTSVFNSSRKDLDPLSNHLRSMVHGSGLLDAVYAATGLDELDELETKIPSELATLRPQPPTLGGMRSGRIGENEGVWVPVPGTELSQPTHRHYIAVQVCGDPWLLTFWPDASEEELTPVDAALQAESAIWTTPWTREDRGRLDAAIDQWQLSETGDRLSDEPEWAVYTFIDLTFAQEKAVRAGDLDLRALFEDRRNKIEPIVAQIGRQTAHYFDVELPRLLNSAVEKRREILTNRAAVTASLTFPDAWVVPQPTLDTSDSSTARGGGVETEAELSDDEDLRIDARARLAPATFEDVQSVIRVWANAIERTPEAFYDLGEDRVSDLLAATLNATLPGAKREVYSREGKSDIFIQADTLAEGRGPAKVFICEAKRATSDKVVQEAVDPQLFGYLTVHDTAAVLLLLFRTLTFDGPRRDRLAALREVKGYIDTENGPSGWPIYKYRTGERHVDLCVASVHIPPKRSKTGSNREPTSAT